jgi:hypothetical protein
MTSRYCEQLFSNFQLGFAWVARRFRQRLTNQEWESGNPFQGPSPAETVRFHTGLTLFFVHLLSEPLVEDPRPGLQQKMRPAQRPLHLLLFDESSADHLIDRRLNEGR